MSFSVNLSSVAQRLLTTYGETITATRNNVSSYNPATGVVVETTPTTYTGIGHPKAYDDAFVNGVTVMSNDIKLLLYSVTLPLIGDEFTIDTEILVCISVKKIRAQGLNIIYEVQLR